MATSRSESSLVIYIMTGVALIGSIAVLSHFTEVLGPLQRQVKELVSSTFFWIVVLSLAVLSISISVFNLVKSRLTKNRDLANKQLTIPHLDFADEEIVLQKFRWLKPEEIQAFIDRLTAREPIDVIKLVEFLLVQAAGQRSSDLHIEPYDDHVLVKFRIDGVIKEIARFEKRIHPRLISRMRILSNLAIYEKGVPQDGRLNTSIMGDKYEVRVSIMPTLHGEKTVIRFFEMSELRFSLDNTGMEPTILTQFKNTITAPQGIIFFTGPTGSGKTTTIYAALKEIYETSQRSMNIVTIEDPIEYDMQQFNQSQVNLARGLTFATGLRTLLRQDPDVIMVGEIRDDETAEIALRAGLTGHLVLTTIHADSAAGVFNRLIEMKIEPFLLASATTAIISQRLVRKLCPHCREEIIPNLSVLEQLRIPLDRVMRYYRATGCPQCMQRGYHGRIGLFELLLVNDEIRELLLQKCATHEIHKAALKQGMVTLLEDGLNKIDQGLTSLEEIQRVII